MAEHESTPAALDADTAARLAASMNGNSAAPAADAGTPTNGSSGQGPWPDGNGKHKHPREHADNPGRSAQAAAVNAVHRTSRPQMPHSH
ncbi:MULTISPECIES: hypothetical protein [Arthrobacter]|uniref:Uncharacterized protein n=2 Tax=Arthrobacter TaxID=1663 RepID=A0ABU9KIA0_9MICC|nr:hypothetical protein [Arthrobacter sp. YJM1]MDP5226364.1 hypothetical protein [Arthrobacter sp. YJM1]